MSRSGRISPNSCLLGVKGQFPSSSQRLSFPVCLLVISPAPSSTPNPRGGSQALRMLEAESEQL